MSTALVIVLAAGLVVLGLLAFVGAVVVAMMVQVLLTNRQQRREQRAWRKAFDEARAVKEPT